MRWMFIALFASTAAVSAQQTSVLFLGNSYTAVNDLPGTFRQLALSLGDTVTTDMVAPGGYQLGNHTDNPASLAAIDAQPWDFVVMQEQSQFGALPFEVSAFEAGAGALVQLIEANDECTYPVFYMTWGRKNGDADNCPFYPEMCTYASMQQALRDNYIAIAEQNDAYLSPVGWAWKHVRDTHPDIELYQPDESHPSVQGTYLAACVFYSALFKQSCVGASFVSTVQPDTAVILQAIASATVLDSLDTWNLNVPNGTDATISGSSSGAWNEITFYHPGEGLHWWICSDGQSSNDANPTFILPGPGTYTFTHTYIDPCGNMDTVTWTTEVYETGVAEGGSPERYSVWSPGPALVEVSGGTGDEMLTVIDLQGRTLVARPLGSDDARIPCPSGLHIWSIRDKYGALRAGKILVP